MRKQLNKLVLMILLPVMAIAPLQGVLAAMDMATMQGMDQMHQVGMQIGLSSVADDGTQKCDHCKKERCCENHGCSNGHCFSSPFMMLSSNGPGIEFHAQTQSALYQSSVVLLLPSMLFRPPRV